MDAETAARRALDHMRPALPTRGPTVLVSERTYSELCGALLDACNVLALNPTCQSIPTLRRAQRALCLAGSPMEESKL